jgi:hypothetical protein
MRRPEELVDAVLMIIPRRATGPFVGRHEQGDFQNPEGTRPIIRKSGIRIRTEAELLHRVADPYHHRLLARPSAQIIPTREEIQAGQISPGFGEPGVFVPLPGDLEGLGAGISPAGMRILESDSADECGLRQGEDEVRIGPTPPGGPGPVLSCHPVQGG